MGFLYDLGDGWLINLLTLDYVKPYDYEGDDEEEKSRPYKLYFYFHNEKTITHSTKTKQNRDDLIKDLLSFVPALKIEGITKMEADQLNNKNIGIELLNQVCPAPLYGEPVKTDNYTIPVANSIINK